MRWSISGLTHTAYTFVNLSKHKSRSIKPVWRSLSYAGSLENKERSHASTKAAHTCCRSRVCFAACAGCAQGRGALHVKAANFMCEYVKYVCRRGRLSIKILRCAKHEFAITYQHTRNACAPPTSVLERSSTSRNRPWHSDGLPHSMLPEAVPGPE